MKNWDDENCVAVAAEPDSPYIDKLRQYIDAERAIERWTHECNNLEKRIAETRAKMSTLRGDLQDYLDQ